MRNRLQIPCHCPWDSIAISGAILQFNKGRGRLPMLDLMRLNEIGGRNAKDLIFSNMLSRNDLRIVADSLRSSTAQSRF